MKAIKNICVYCGSSRGKKAVYAATARLFAASLVKRNMGLVYGGASIGIMGEVADHVLKLGGKVIGIIPEALVRKEIVHNNLTELLVTKSMHERKMRMAELSDGFIALPGGLGTLEEIFEIWTWAQLGFHDKPCGLLNVAGYFDPLCSFLDHATAEHFIHQQHRSMLLVDDDPEALLEQMLAYRAPAVTHWVDKDET